jgi:hypothetical protein
MVRRPAAAGTSRSRIARPRPGNRAPRAGSRCGSSRSDPTGGEASSRQARAARRGGDPSGSKRRPFGLRPERGEGRDLRKARPEVLGEGCRSMVSRLVEDRGAIPESAGEAPSLDGGVTSPKRASARWRSPTLNCSPAASQGWPISSGAATSAFQKNPAGTLPVTPPAATGRPFPSPGVGVRYRTPSDGLGRGLESRSGRDHAARPRRSRQRRNASADVGDQSQRAMRSSRPRRSRLRDGRPFRAPRSPRGSPAAGGARIAQPSAMCRPRISGHAIGAQRLARGDEPRKRSETPGAAGSTVPARPSSRGAVAHREIDRLGRSPRGPSRRERGHTRPKERISDMVAS